MKSVSTHLLLALLVYVLTGCACCDREDVQWNQLDTAPQNAEVKPQPDEGPKPIALNANQVRMSNGGTFTVGYMTDPDPIPLNELFSIEVRLSDADGPADDVTLIADADMPAHRHGMLRRPTVEKRSPGVFLVTGMQFHMPGEWVLYFDITQGGVTERAQFDVELD